MSHGPNSIGGVCDCQKPTPGPDGRSCVSCGRILPTVLRLSDIDLQQFKPKPTEDRELVTPEKAHHGCANELANAAAILCQRANSHMEHARQQARFAVVKVDEDPDPPKPPKVSQN